MAQERTGSKRRSGDSDPKPWVTVPALCRHRAVKAAIGCLVLRLSPYPRTPGTGNNDPLWLFGATYRLVSIP